MLQVCCSVLQGVAVCCGVYMSARRSSRSCSVSSVSAVKPRCVAVCCSVLQCVAVYCSVLRCVTVCCSVLQCVAVCCSVLQCVAVCRSLLQCVNECAQVVEEL